MWEAGLQPESIGSTSSPKASSEDTAHWRRWWRLTGTAHLFLCPSGPPCCWVYNKTRQIPNHSPTVRPPLSHPWPVCPPYAQHSHGHHRALERKQRRASQALVSWIYFGFFFVVVGFFHRTLCSRQKLALQSVGTSLARAQPSAPRRAVSPGPFSRRLAFITFCYFFFSPFLPFFLCFFFPSLLFITLLQAFSKGRATGSGLADYRRALGHVGWFPPPASQLTWSR